MEKVKVLAYGVGVVGGLIAKFLLEKEGVEIVAAIDVAKDKVGKDLGEVLGLKKKVGVKISDDIDSVLSKLKADVAIHATSSYLKDTYSQLASIIEHGVNVISTCEELSYPYVSEPKLAKKLEALAKKHDVTVLGTGINPGFLMDTLVITLTAPCQKIEKIEATRVMNAATRRLPFQKKIGAGLSVKEFTQKIEKKHITGHVGLEQSIAMVADALAWKLDEIVVEPVEPVISKRPVQSRDIKVSTGRVAGLKQKAKGIVKGKEVIALDFRAYIGAEEEYDAVTIEGVPEIREKISPCVHGDMATVAMIVNSIPKVINAPAGLLTMKDLPVPSATVEDMRKYVKAV
jgi:4-hydroxy-tetrahydrodipicolinate reductase